MIKGVVSNHDEAHIYLDHDICRCSDIGDIILVYELVFLEGLSG